MQRELADVFFFVAAGLYLAATLMFMAYLVGSSAAPKIVKVAPRLIGVGAALHAGHIVLYSLVLRVCPVEGIHFPMSVASMLTCAGYVMMRTRWRIDVVGAFVAPLALTTILASRLVGDASIGPRVRSAIAPFHVTMNLLGVALFSLAFAAAMLYLVQEKLLKAKRIEGLFQRLPPLDSLDRAEHRFLLMGFPLLTLGIVTGTLWARQLSPGSSADVARTAFGYVTWLLFAAVLLLRAAAGWRGRRAAYGTIAGFGFAVLVLILYWMRTRASS
jgi:ABC-type uncharacterized transport system permease subunit